MKQHDSRIERQAWRQAALLDLFSSSEKDADIDCPVFRGLGESMGALRSAVTVQMERELSEWLSDWDQ